MKYKCDIKTKVERRLKIEFETVQDVIADKILYFSWYFLHINYLHSHSFNI